MEQSSAFSIVTWRLHSQCGIEDVSLGFVSRVCLPELRGHEASTALAAWARGVVGVPAVVSTYAAAIPTE